MIWDFTPRGSIRFLDSSLLIPVSDSHDLRGDKRISRLDLGKGLDMSGKQVGRSRRLTGFLGSSGASFISHTADAVVS